jgi:hypothetical protein
MHGVKLRLVSNIGSENAKNARLKDSSFDSPSGSGLLVQILIDGEWLIVSGQGTSVLPKYID